MGNGLLPQLVRSCRAAWCLLRAGVVVATACLAGPTSSAANEDVVATIPEIQGRGAGSPLAGHRVSTEGAVTRVDSDGFFLQDPAGDGDPRTPDGLFVYTGATPTVAAARCVRVSGLVVDHAVGADSIEPAAGGAAPAMRTVTELHDASIAMVEPKPGASCVVAPVDVTLPLPPGDSLARFDGMLVRLRGPLMVQQNYLLGRFGQLTLAAGTRVEAPTNRVAPGAAARAMAAADARRMLLLDDGSAHQDPAPAPFLGDGGTVRAGDTVSDITGVIDAGPATARPDGLAAWKIQPVRPVRFLRTNPRTPAPDALGGTLKIASANIDNFFSTTADGTNVCAPSQTKADCRGARNAREFERQRAKIVAELAAIDADVVGLMEVENDGPVTLQSLVDALNARLGGSVYARVADPREGCGHDAIKVALIYKPSRVRPVGAARSDLDAIHNRAPLAQTFEAIAGAAADARAGSARRVGDGGASGARFNIVVSHFKSRRCDGADGLDLDQHDLQGCWNHRRVLQARALRRFAAAVALRSGIDRMLLVGDFNAYAREDPVAELTSDAPLRASLRSPSDMPPHASARSLSVVTTRAAGATAPAAGERPAVPASGFIDQIARFDPAGYTFVYDGAAGRLDEVLASASLSPRVTGVAIWHVNADEPALLDYSLAFRAPACASCAPDGWTPTPWRASDHDPVVIGLRLEGGP
jgi:predicted extracellular nuclease